MLRRHLHSSLDREDAAVGPAYELERDGHVLLRGVFDALGTASGHGGVDRAHRESPPDHRTAWPPDCLAAGLPDRRSGALDPPCSEMFRDEVSDRSLLDQGAIGTSAVLTAVEPPLGEDRHAIANRSWPAPPDRASARSGTWTAARTSSG